MFHPEQLSEFPPEVSSITPQTRLTRSLFLRLVTASLLVGTISLSSLPKNVLAEEWVVYAANKPWQDNNWFPLDPDVAAERGLVTLDSSLNAYDRLHRSLLKTDSRLQPDFRNFADDYLNKFQGTREWAGFCHGLTHLSLDPQPLVDPEHINLDNGEVVEVTYLHRLGIGAALHSGDLMVRPVLGNDTQTGSTRFVQENLDGLMDAFVTSRRPFVINAPKAGQSGYWYRAVYAVTADRSSLLATNLNAPGEEWVPVPRGRVVEAYTPVPWKEAQGIDGRLFAEIPDPWRFDNRMDGSLVRRILYEKF